MAILFSQTAIGKNENMYGFGGKGTGAPVGCSDNLAIHLPEGYILNRKIPPSTARKPLRSKYVKCPSTFSIKNMVLLLDNISYSFNKKCASKTFSTNEVDVFELKRPNSNSGIEIKITTTRGRCNPREKQTRLNVYFFEDSLQKNRTTGKTSNYRTYPNKTEYRMIEVKMKLDKGLYYHTKKKLAYRKSICHIYDPIYFRDEC